MAGLENIRIAHTILSDDIVLARVGKDRNEAIDAREVTAEFFNVLVSFSFKGRKPAPGGSVEIHFGYDGEDYALTLTRVVSQGAI